MNDKIKKKSKKKGFTLIELSIVFVVIALIAAAIAGTHVIIGVADLNKAKALTKNSIVNSTPNLALWLETTTDASFDKSERTNGSTISNWYDLNTQITTTNDATQTNNSNKPKYVKEGINKLPALDFDGVNNYMSVENSDIMNTPNWTIFSVFNVDVNKNYNFLVVKGLDAFENYEVFFSSATDFSAGVLYTDTTRANLFADTNIVANKNYIFTFTHGVNGGVATYLNGQVLVTTGSSAGKVPQINAQKLWIGTDNLMANRYFDGNIGEIIIFSRVVSNSEREAIEKYLSDKWKISVVVTAGSGSGSCSAPNGLSNGTWTGNPSSGINGQTVNGACNSGYNGSATITCNSGSWSAISGSCTPNSCTSTSSGYVTIANAAAWSPLVGTIASGSSVTTSCNSGYSGSIAAMTCNVGTWSGGAGSCVSSGCGAPPALTNGTWSASSATSGQTVNATCNGGFHSSLDTIVLHQYLLAWQEYSIAPVNITCNNGSYGSRAGSCVAYPTTCPAVSFAGFDECDGPPVATSSYNFPLSANNTVRSANCLSGQLESEPIHSLKCLNGVWTSNGGRCNPYYRGDGC